MQHEIEIKLQRDEVNKILRECALAKIDIGKPYDTSTAMVWWDKFDKDYVVRITITVE